MTTGCYCIGPQNGEKECPCRLRDRDYNNSFDFAKYKLTEIRRPMGWECPKCGGVHAPFVPSCTNCAPKMLITSNSST